MKETNQRGTGPSWNRMGLALALAGTVLLSSGCAEIPRNRVDVLPAPVRSFPPVKPGIVRLPVDISFPSGGDLIQHLSNLFKGGFKQLLPDLNGMPGSILIRMYRTFGRSCRRRFSSIGAFGF